MADAGSPEFNIEDVYKTLGIDFETLRVRTLEELKRRWTEEKLLSADELKELLSRKEFGQQVAEAIKRTNSTQTAKTKYRGQEFGFSVYFNRTSISSDFVLSPLFEGEETMIRTVELSHSHKKNNDIPGLPILFFHTHPNDRLNREYIYELGTSVSKLFSRRDLTSFSLHATVWPSAIDALGTLDNDSDEGRLLLVSFPSFKTILDFDPAAVVKDSMSIRNLISEDILKAYKKAGLNTFEIPVTLEGSNPLDPAKIEQASKVLTTRNPN